MQQFLPVHAAAGDRLEQHEHGGVTRGVRAQAGRRGLPPGFQRRGVAMFAIRNPIQGLGGLRAFGEADDFALTAGDGGGGFAGHRPAGAAKAIERIVNGMPVALAIHREQDKPAVPDLVEPLHHGGALKHRGLGFAQGQVTSGETEPARGQLRQPRGGPGARQQSQDDGAQHRDQERAPKKFPEEVVDAGRRGRGGNSSHALVVVARMIRDVATAVTGKACASQPRTGIQASAPASQTMRRGPVGNKADTEPFRLGPGDRVDLEVLGRAGSRGSTFVCPDGKIYYDLLPGVDVWGVTLAESKEVLERELAKYNTGPQLSVILTAVESKRVWVVGRLNKSGVYPINGPTTIIEAIARAGGLFTSRFSGTTEELADLKADC